MTFGLAPGKLGFKIGDVLVGLQAAAERVVAGMKQETSRAM